MKKTLLYCLILCLSASFVARAADNSCTPVYSVNNLKEVTKVTISSGTATGTSNPSIITNSFDGDYKTYFYTSKYTPMPHSVTYNFTDVPRVDFFVLTPKANVGLIKEVEIYYATTDAPNDFKLDAVENFGGINATIHYRFKQPIINPASVRLVVNSSSDNSVIITEMEFFKQNGDLIYPEIFSDAIMSGLKEGVNQAAIDAMPDGFFKQLAQCMFNGTYNKKYRIAEYEPYHDVIKLQSELKTENSYSKLENPTGIFFAPKDTVVIFVEDTHGEKLSLTTTLGGSKREEYSLGEGINVVPINNGGLGFIGYFTPRFKEKPKVRIHITGGKVDGYYDVEKTTPEEYQSMIEAPVSGKLFLQGKRMGLLVQASEMKKYNPMDAKPLVNIYDSIVKQVWEIMGLYKYNRVPKNHIHGEIELAPQTDWFANMWGVFWRNSTEVTLDVNRVISNSWGITHEIGHINQVKPGLLWIGLSEVTNNIYATMVRYNLNPPDLTLEVEDKSTKINRMLNDGVINKVPYLYQNNEDWKTRLVPFWQLMLNYTISGSPKKEWFQDLNELYRTTDDVESTSGQKQLNFVKYTCDMVKEDLTDYFVNVGMLRTLDRDYTDMYITTPIRLVITPADSAATVEYIKSKNYPKPASPVLHYLSHFNLNAYVNKLPVTGGKIGEGCLLIARQVIVNHTVWKNAVAFETYQDDKLVSIAVAGSGYADNSRTVAQYPEGSTAMYAVAWDGTRTLVYGVPTGLSSEVLLPVDISPNPVQSSFQIKGLDNGGNLEIYDLAGKLIFSKSVLNHEVVSVEQLNKGIYFAKISNSTGAKTIKIIKK